MMGLQTRLKMARTLVWVGLQTSPQALAELVGRLCAGRADVVVVVQPDATGDDLLIGYRAALAAGDGRTIIGLAGDAAEARRASADLVAHDAALPAVHGHEYSLSLAVASDARELEKALADDQVSAVVVTPALVQLAIELAPPAQPESKPWFAQTETLAQGRELITAGARRLALESPAITAEQDLGMGPDAVVGAYRDALASSWRAEMDEVSFAAPRSDGPVPSGRPDPTH